MNVYDFEGRVAVVTGGARGIGRAVAERLSAGGAAVAVWDMDGEAAERARRGFGARSHAQALDVTDAAAVGEAVRASEAALGPIDILVNSAGITGPNATSWDYPVADWRRVIEVDLTGTFLCARAVVTGMMARGYGRIVNIASVAGKEGNPQAPAYSAAKAGVIAFTKSLAKETVKTGVAVTCVAPAAVETDIFRQMTPEFTQFMLSKIPMGRFGTVEEVAALVAWLASEECSFSTGACFDISGGRATY